MVSRLEKLEKITGGVDERVNKKCEAMLASVQREAEKQCAAFLKTKEEKSAKLHEQLNNKIAQTERGLEKLRAQLDDVRNTSTRAALVQCDILRSELSETRSMLEQQFEERVLSIEKQVEIWQKQELVAFGEYYDECKNVKEPESEIEDTQDKLPKLSEEESNDEKLKEPQSTPES